MWRRTLGGRDMSENSAIEWTHHTFNPWWGCVKVSAACKNCYAEAWAHRLGKDVWGANAPRRFLGPAYWHAPHSWNEKARKEGQRKRVFCASMSDVFEQLPPEHPQTAAMDNARALLWGIIDSTPWLDWLLLTKRPENITSMMPLAYAWKRSFPSNVWRGATVEDQAAADKRIPFLMDGPPGIRFLSCEPMQEAITLPPAFLALGDKAWVICGGESGHGARPMHPAWARSLRDQCAEAGVPFLFKQWGDLSPTSSGFVNIGKKAAGRVLDGVVHDGYPTP